MKNFLIFLFVSSPAWACKPTPEGAKLKTEATIRSLFPKKEIMIRQNKNNSNYTIRTKKPTCIEYQVEVDNGKGDCRQSAKILSQRPCP